MDAEASGVAPAGPARRVLEQQERLIRWQVTNERAGFVLRLGLGLAGLAAAVVVAVMAWAASRADGLVVEPFSVPPALAERGVTGAAVAGEVLNQFARLNTEARISDVLQVSDSWSGESHVEIPQTGVSLDEVNRLLRRWLGRQTYVSGAVMLTGEGAIELTARTGQGELVRARGAADSLPELSGALAEQLLAQVKPSQYGRVLFQRGALDQAIAVLSAVIRTSTDRDELRDAHSGLGVVFLVTGRRQDAANELRRAAEAGAKNAYLLISYAERGLGHHRLANEASELAMRNRPSNLPKEALRAYDGQVRSNAAQLQGDFLTAEQLARQVIGRDTRLGNGGALAGATAGIENHIVPLIGLHEIGRARREVSLLATSGMSAARIESFRTNMLTRIAADAGDWTGVLAALDVGPPNPTGGHLETPTPDAWRALALAHLGRLDEARTLAVGLAPDCYRCWINRGEVAALAGDRRGADAAFAEAVRQAPKAPFADTAWGAALMAHGDATGAITHLRQAVRLAPRFADPRALWGEALLARGDAAGAAKQFAKAQPFAPRWGRLHLKWGEALAKLGKADEARAKWRAAAGMDLSPADRLELQGRLTHG